MKSLYTIVGMKHRGTEKALMAMPAGEPMELRRERDNKFDAKAVQVWARGQHIGYVKATENTDLAFRMDRATEPAPIMGKLVPTRWWPQVEVET